MPTNRSFLKSQLVRRLATRGPRHTVAAVRHDPPAPTTPDYAAWYANYLRRASASETMQRYKSRSYEIVGAAPGMQIVDIGCGLGGDVAALAEIVGPTGSVVGIDHDPQLLERAEGEVQLHNVRFERADARQLPFPAASFDGARLDRVLQHIPESEAVVAEMVRVLRSGARAVAIEPDYGTYAVDVQDRTLARRILDARTDAYGNGWAGRQLLRLFTAAGLQDVQVEPVVIFHRNYAEARAAIDLDHADQFAQGAGVLVEGDADRWRSLIAEATSAQTFFSAIVLFMVCGTKS